MDKIYLSPSSLAAWYDMGCPAQWKFDRDWELVEPNPITEFGTKIHKMLEDPEYAVQEIPNDRRAASYYSKIKSARDSIVDEILHTELRQRFVIGELPEDIPILWGRRLDLIARLKDGTISIIDYKTHLGRGWKSLKSGKKEIYPQAKGFQSAGYLWPSPEMPEGIDSWPTSVIYIVGSLSASAQIIRYDYHKEDMANLDTIISSAAWSIYTSHGEKRPGKHCHDCKFAAMCYKSPGWKKLYKERYSGNKSGNP